MHARIRTLHGAIQLSDGAITVSGAGVAADLVDAIRTGDVGSLAVEDGRLSVSLLQPVTPGPASAPASRERSIDVDMTNWCVIVDDSLVVKVFSEWGGGDRSSRQLAILEGTGLTPDLYGSIEWHREDRSTTTLAVVTELIDGASDGWTWAVDEVLAHREGGDEPRWPTALGELVGRMHRILASAGPAESSPPALRGHELRERARAVLDDALQCTSGETRQRLNSRVASILTAIESMPDEPAGSVFDIHGDLHVGQVLRSRAGYRVLDFDGDPQLSHFERERPERAARDIAHLASSIELVAAVAMRRFGSADDQIAHWASRAIDQFLTAYQSLAADLLDERLLPGMHAEQLLRELTYADRFLPRWLYAADGAISYRFAPSPDTLEVPWTSPA